MACPYFYPVEAGVVGSDARSAMLPLGDLWGGGCHAAADAPWKPGDAMARQLCNLGYARGTCPRFPKGDGPDAVRFTVRGADGAAVHLYYVVERDHEPFAHGALDYAIAAKALVSRTESAVLSRQAEAYAESYLRRSGGR
jgi:hypothetical protein